MDFFETLIATIAPHRCKGCNSEGSLLCVTCRLDVVTKTQTCYNCNHRSPGGRTCASCRKHSQLAGVIVAAHYDGVVKQLVHALKYQAQVAAAAVMTDLLTPLLDPTDFDLVITIPGAPSHYRGRGYHQAQLIGRRVARRLGLPYRTVLGRLEVPSQVGSSRAERLAQVTDSFWLRGASVVKGQRILVLDDVLTTGATLSEAATVLTAAGAQSVWGAVVAKH